MVEGERNEEAPLGRQEKFGGCSLFTASDQSLNLGAERPQPTMLSEPILNPVSP